MFVVWLWIKEAFLGLFRNIRWNMTAVFLSTLCLFLFSASYILGLNASYFASMLDDKIEVKVYLLDSITNYDEVEKQLSEKKNVQSVTFVSKDQALEKAKNEFGEDADIFDALDENPLPASFVVKLKDTSKINAFVSDVEKMKIAEQTEYGKGFVEKILVSAKSISKAGYILTVFGILFTIFIVFSAIQNNILRRRNEIRIKQLIGASNVTVRIPFIIEAIFLTLLSSGVVYGVFYYGLPKMMAMIKEGIPYINLMDASVMLDQLSLPLFILAVGIGFAGSVLSTYRNIKQ